MKIQSVKQRFGIIGRSPALENALKTAIRVAPTESSVLITGESGVGKEVFSKIIHALSRNKHNKFIAVNCGAIPAGTINSELFGHEKGAFTGAGTERKGYFETVDGGTIFLDEIGEMPLVTQTFLLRVLENGEFTRVGSSKVLKTKVRVVAATNVNLYEKVQQGKFREDLYYRLRTVPIKVPALRERTEDILLLFRKFTTDFAERYRTSPIELDDRAEILLENYTWQGNIRQLKNVAEQLSILAEERLITAEMLLDIVPDILNRNLPIATKAHKNGGSGTMEERDILYQLLFDMKHDLNDLKSLVFELIKDNNLNVPNRLNLQLLEAPNTAPPTTVYPAVSKFKEQPKEALHPYPIQHKDAPTSIIIKSNNQHDDYEEVEEENLKLEDMERVFIEKALKKHNGKRKDAAQELGISERTLYRKILGYKIKE